MKYIFNYFKLLPLKEATKFLVIFYIVGITGFLLPYTRNIFEQLIPVSLSINIFLLFLYHGNFNKKHILFFASVIVLTILIEALGVETGILFGEYFYGDALALKIFNTPVLIGFNWLMLSYGAVSIIRSNPALNKFLPILTGVFLTLFDFVMEPVAMKTGMWYWAMNTVPIQNYIMWFIIATTIGAGFALFKIDTANKMAQRIFIAQLIFFGALNLFLL